MKFTPEQLDFIIRTLEAGGGMQIFLALAIKAIFGKGGK